MVSKYRKSFVSTGALTGEPVTILVEYIEAKGFKGVSIESLEGEFTSPEEFETAYKRHSASDEVVSDKIYNFLPMTLRTAQTLKNLLGEAMAASEGH
ncbi:hypothetical protein LCGC14_2980280 [marine sediment metagenome]|uniref:Uncharacterized protein n=1 Tax=marine sediment metagenome TaxID=412755 RepID=A0A0F8ZEB5_9ZZZZ